MVKKLQNKVSSKGKKQGFFSKLKPNTPLKQLVMVALIFGILGGGFLVYKSFAASGGAIATGNQLVVVNYPAYQIYEGSAGNKKGMKVWEIDKGGKIRAQSFNNPVPTSPHYAKTCVVAAAGPAGYGPIGMTVENAAGQSVNFTLQSNSNDYRKYCTGYSYVSKYDPYWLGRVSTPGLIRVSSMTYEWL